MLQIHVIKILKTNTLFALYSMNYGRNDKTKLHSTSVVKVYQSGIIQIITAILNCLTSNVN